jgi:hypothetical protein
VTQEELGATPGSAKGGSAQRPARCQAELGSAKPSTQSRYKLDRPRVRSSESRTTVRLINNDASVRSSLNRSGTAPFAVIKSLNSRVALGRGVAHEHVWPAALARGAAWRVQPRRWKSAAGKREGSGAAINSVLRRQLRVDLRGTAANATLTLGLVAEFWNRHQAGRDDCVAIRAGWSPNRTPPPRTP